MTDSKDVDGRVMDKGAKILAVDDSFTTRRILKKYVSELGFTNVDEATDGNVAWDKIMSSSPRYSIVFLDWQMPNCDGLELLKRIRAHAEFKNLPVIMATAERKKEEVAKAVAAGATGYMVKPYEKETIEKMLKQFGPYIADK